MNEEKNIIDKETETDDKEKQPMTENELREQYEQLPMWKHIILVAICIFAMIAVFMLIDFAVDFLVELAKHIF